MATKRKSAAQAPAFNHAMVYVTDVERALAFYRRLGFRLLQRFRHDGMTAYARLRSLRGQTTIALHRTEPGQDLGDTHSIRLYFEVRDLEAYCKRLEKAGLKFTQLPQMMPWGWQHAYLNDPDGHEVSLYWAGKRRLLR